MKTRLAILAAMVCAPMLAYALPEPGELTMAEALTDAAAAPTKQGPCAKVALTDAQKASIKDLMYKNADARIQAKADFEKAAVAYAHTFSDSTSTKDQGAAAQADLSKAGMAAAQLMMDFDLSVTYDILTPDQRAPAFACKRAMMHHHKGGHGHHGGGHHGGNGNGGTGGGDNGGSGGGGGNTP